MDNMGILVDITFLGLSMVDSREYLVLFVCSFVRLFVCSCHCAWRAIFARNRSVLFMPLRVAGYFRQKPFRLVSGTFLRADATPCTHNDCWWLAKVG
jgi:hypothetical protein